MSILNAIDCHKPIWNSQIPSGSFTWLKTTNPHTHPFIHWWSYSSSTAGLSLHIMSAANPSRWFSFPLRYNRRLFGDEWKVGTSFWTYRGEKFGEKLSQFLRNVQIQLGSFSLAKIKLTYVRFVCYTVCPCIPARKQLLFSDFYNQFVRTIIFGLFVSIYFRGEIASFKPRVVSVTISAIRVVHDVDVTWLALENAPKSYFYFPFYIQLWTFSLNIRSVWQPYGLPETSIK